MEIQPLTFDDLSLSIPYISDQTPAEDSFINAMTVSSSGYSWRRLKSESISFFPTIDPVNHSLAQDIAAKNLLRREIEELKITERTLAAAKKKHKKGFGHKVAKFWKKHKKAIIITAAVVAVAAAVVVAVAATGGGAAAGAAVAGSAAGGTVLKPGGKGAPQTKPNPSPIPTQPIPNEQPVFPYPFQTLDLYPFPEAITFGKNGIYCDGNFTSYDDTLLKTPSIADSSWANNWLRPSETTFPALLDISSPKPFQPIFSDLAPTSSPDIRAFAFQSRGDWALDIGYSDQALEDFNKALEIQPDNPSSYLGRGVAYLELGQYDACIADYDRYSAFAPKEFSLTDFSIGFAEGLPKGIYESGEGILLFLSDLVTSPIQTGSQVYDSLSHLSRLVKTGEWEAVGAALSPEVHELITQWDTLPDNRKGELAGYAFGKHGADIFLPGAAVKIAAKGTTAVRELGAVCKNLQSAEKVFVLEAIAQGNHSGINIGEALAAAERTLAAGEDLGLTTRQMAELKQAGALEQTIGKGRDFFAGNLELQASYDLVKKAQEDLVPHKKIFMAEQQIKDLIQQTGIATFERPPGIPDDFLVRITEKGAGIEYVHPANPKITVRVMPGTPHSPNPSQQVPYVVQLIENKAVDKTGNLVSPKSPGAHIPLEEFTFREKLTYGNK